MKKVVFLASPAHAGTTLTELVIGSYPSCFSLGEFHNVANKHVWGKFPSCSVCGYDCEFWANFAINRKKMPLHEAAFASAPSGTNILTDSSKPVPWITETSKKLPKDYDWKVISVIRNPYGSLAHKIMQQESSISPAHVNFWKNRVTQQLWIAENMPKRVFTVKYEELAVEPDVWFKKIFDFIGLDYDPGYKDFWKTHHHIHSGNSTPVTMVQTFHGIEFRHEPPLKSCYTASIEKFLQNARKDFTGADIGYTIRLDQRYKQVLKKPEKRLITNMTRPLLEQLGYEIEV